MGGMNETMHHAPPPPLAMAGTRKEERGIFVIPAACEVLVGHRAISLCDRERSRERTSRCLRVTHDFT